jgi:hypothetical protein
VRTRIEGVVTVGEESDVGNRWLGDKGLIGQG